MAPHRIVSLVPSTTESVCRLGAAPQLVGCTRYCTEPAASLQHVTRVGGTKNPDREAILRLSPDLLLANAEENREPDLQWLAQRVHVEVQTPRTVPEAAAALRQLAQWLDREDVGHGFVQRIDDWLGARASVGRTSRAPHAYYAIWRRPWMTVNRDTFVHDVLDRLGVVNVAADEPVRYPEVEPEVAVARGADVVLLASEPWAFDEAQCLELQAHRTFGPAQVVLCDGRDFCWHGVHMVEGLPRAAAVLQRLR